jgi:hypothetical protein
LGLELLIGLLLGIPALLAGVLADRRAGVETEAVEEDLHEHVGGSDKGNIFCAGPHKKHLLSRSAPERVDPNARMHLAVAVSLIVWVLTGIALFSIQIRLHPRYVEGFMPAVAALLGIGVAWAATGRDRARLVALVVALGGTVYYVERLLYERSGLWWLTLACALGAVALAVVARVRPSRPALGLPDTRRARLLGGATVALTLVAVLALPLRADLNAIADNVSDAGAVGALPHEEQQLVSAYTIAHQGGARYELAAESATQIGSLIVQDARPVVLLTTYNARVFTNVAKLRRLIKRGEVRYAFLNTFCDTSPSFISTNAACSEPVRWIRAHGADVSLAAGLHRGGVLYLLPGATP